MEDIFLALNIRALVVCIFISFCIYFFLVRKSLYAWFDPLFAYVFFNSFSIGLVLYLYIQEDSIKLFYLQTFFLSVAGFIVGIKFFYTSQVKRLGRSSGLDIDLSNFNAYGRLLSIALVICLSVLLFSNALLMVITGTVPILSDNPTEAKVELYSGGFGIVRRIDFVFISVAYAIIFLKLLNPLNRVQRKTKYLLWGAFFFNTLVLLSMGSKSALLKILDVFFPIYLINIKWKDLNAGIFREANTNISKIKHIAKYLIIVGVFYMLLVVVKSSAGGPASDSILTRFIASGDTFYFFYNYDLYTDFHFNFLDFIAHIFNPLLGMLRLVPYEDPIGALILYDSIGLPVSSFGPNAQHAVEGLIYFGPFLCFFYSLLVGMLINYTRFRLLVKLSKRPNQLKLLIYIVLGSFVVACATESSLFFIQFFDLIIWGTLLLLISMVVKSALSIQNG